MITPGTGDLLEADAEALVNPVNCAGVMGRGLALQFKRAFPENFAAYARACQAHELRPGRMLVVATGRPDNPKYVINFPTKDHWRSPSRLRSIEDGLESLVDELRRRAIRSVAVPALGCGNGGLDWRDVEPVIRRAFAALPDVAVRLYAPWGARARPAFGLRADRDAGASGMGDDAAAEDAAAEDAAAEDPATQGPGQPPIGAVIARIGESLPPGALDDVPTDLAGNLDHYLYGAPKRG